MSPTKTGAREWAEVSFNLASSDGRCPHECLYCYAPERLRRFGFTPKQKLLKHYADLIMFPTRHDVVPENLSESIHVLTELLKFSNRVIIVTKGAPYCVRAVCQELMPWMSQILWRVTIGGRNGVCSKWEPRAPAPLQRLEALIAARAMGYQTSVSMEPILEPSVRRTIDLCEELLPRVTETIWLGLMNRAAARVRMNGGTPEQIRMAKSLTDYWSMAGCSHVHDLFDGLRDEPKVRWKDSIQKVLSIDSQGRPTA